eukprot:13327988-Alexandrium_andersonii.AAC.1
MVIADAALGRRLGQRDPAFARQLGPKAPLLPRLHVLCGRLRYVCMAPVASLAAWEGAPRRLAC